MKKVNFLVLAAAAVAMVSVFLPWMEVTTEASVADQISSFSSGNISGIVCGGGLLGLFLILAGVFFALRNNRWTFLFGAISTLDAMGYLLGWFGSTRGESVNTVNVGEGVAKVSVELHDGLYLFAAASLVFTLFALVHLFAKRAKKPHVQIEEPQPYEEDFVVEDVPVQEPIEKVTPIQETNIQESPVMTTPTNPETPIEKEPIVQPEAAPAKPVQPAAEKVIPTATYQKEVNETDSLALESLRKKANIFMILTIALGLMVLGGGIYLMSNSSTKETSQQTEQSINDEKLRLDKIIVQVNQEVRNKNYEEALIKLNSVNWLFAPGSNKDYVDQYDSQRENIRKTILDLKKNQELTDQILQAAKEKSTQTDSLAQGATDGEYIPVEE